MSFQSGIPKRKLTCITHFHAHIIQKLSALFICCVNHPYAKDLYTLTTGIKSVLNCEEHHLAEDTAEFSFVNLLPPLL